MAEWARAIQTVSRAIQGTFNNPYQMKISDLLCAMTAIGKTALLIPVKYASLGATRDTMIQDV